MERKHLTEEQKQKLAEVAHNFVERAAWGWDMEIDEDNFDDYVQEELIDDFIEPLINGELC